MGGRLWGVCGLWRVGRTINTQFSERIRVIREEPPPENRDFRTYGFLPYRGIYSRTPSPTPLRRRAPAYQVLAGGALSESEDPEEPVPDPIGWQGMSRCIEYTISGVCCTGNRLPYYMPAHANVLRAGRVPCGQGRGGSLSTIRLYTVARAYHYLIITL